MKPYFYFVCYSARNNATSAVIMGNQLVQRILPIDSPAQYDEFYEFVCSEAQKKQGGNLSTIIIVNFFLLQRDEQNETAN